MKYTNPFIKVTWEDTPENFTAEKSQRIKTYFQNKYKTNYVKIYPKSISLVQNTKLDSLDVSDKILDQQYQKTLMKDFIEQNKIDIKWDMINRLDEKVNVEINKNNQNKVRFNKWFIKKISFSNFLSFGENNVIDFTNLDGISVIESSPKNFGGKCVKWDTLIDIKCDFDAISKLFKKTPEDFKNKATLKDIFCIFEDKRMGVINDDINIKVNTPYGFKNIIDCQITEKNGKVFKITTDNGLSLECSINHRLKLVNDSFVTIKDLSVNDEIQTALGNSKVISIEDTGVFEDLYDIQVDEVEQYYSNGMVSHNSTMSVDLLMFLFFNTTTKTKTNAEIFNKFTDKNEVVVIGDIVIDGLNYVIERKIIRKKSKTNEYTVVNKLEFYKKNEDGSIENLNGEQRKNTEQYISSAIGTEDDFLSTILTTGYNLEQLIDSKPTSRGQLLTKLLGLELLKEKEEIAKAIFNEWSKKLLSNTNNVTQLQTNNKIYENSIDDSKEQIKSLEKELVNYKDELKTLELKKDSLLLSKRNDIDIELIKTNPVQLQSEIDQLILQQTKIKEKISEIDVVEPSEYYNEDHHDLLKSYINQCQLNNIIYNNNIANSEKSIKQFQDGLICLTCKRPLEDVNYDAEIAELTKDIERNNVLITENNSKLVSYEKDDITFKKLKLQLDSYEKNKIIKGKCEIEFEHKLIEINNKKTKLTNYDNNKQKLEINKKVDFELTLIKTKIETTTANIRVTENNIQKHNSNVISMNEKIVVNLDIISKINSETELMNIFKTYLTIYGKNGLSKSILKNMIPLLNKELYQLLIDSCHFMLELSINDRHEVEFVMVDNETRVIKPLNSGSGYEKTISSLALRAVLTKISSLPKPNIVVMDEVFGKIADENIEMVGEFFKKIKSYFEHIIIISHNPLIRNWSDNLIMVKKEDNISSIEKINFKF